MSIVEYPDAGSKEERRQRAGKALGEFIDYFRPRRLFLPETTLKKIDEFVAELHKTTIAFMFNVEKHREHFKSLDVDQWTKADDYVTKEAPKLLKDLENDFRRILGADCG